MRKPFSKLLSALGMIGAVAAPAATPAAAQVQTRAESRSEASSEKKQAPTAPTRAPQNRAELRMRNYAGLSSDRVYYAPQRSIGPPPWVKGSRGTHAKASRCGMAARKRG